MEPSGQPAASAISKRRASWILGVGFVIAVALLTIVVTALEPLFGIGSDDPDQSAETAEPVD